MYPYCRTSEYQVVESTCFDDILIHIKEMARDDRQQGSSFHKTNLQLLVFLLFCYYMSYFFDGITAY